MAEWWIITLGFIFCLGLALGCFIYVLIGALHLEDATRIDPLPKEK